VDQREERVGLHARRRIAIGGKPGGSDAEHFVHSAYARLTIPIRSGMSVGLDGALFLRESYFSREDS